MPRDGNGNYTRTQPDYVFGTIIDETKVNSEFNDIGNALTDSVAADGQTTPTASLKFGGFPLVGVGDASNRPEAAATGQVQDGAFNYALDTGAADAYVITPTPTVTSQQAGRVWRVNIGPANTNTGACTLKVSAQIPVAIKTLSGGDPPAGSIQGGQIYEITDGGTGNSYLIAAVQDIPDGSITTDKLADNSVTNAKMADNAIDTVEIVDGATTLAKQAAGTQGGLIHYAGAGALPADSGAGAAGEVWTSNGAGADADWAAAAGGGKFTQVVTAPIVVFTGTAQIPADNTVPLVSEGQQVVTANITPSTTTAHVLVTTSFTIGASGASGDVIVTVFRGSTCIGAAVGQAGSGSSGDVISIEIDDAPATAGVVTYELRIGRAGASFTNYAVSQTGGYTLGGVMASSVMRLMEFEP